MKPKILITGGVGYVGSHTCVELVAAGFDLLVVDNLCNSKIEAIRRIEAICGSPIEFHAIDIRDRNGLRQLFHSNHIAGVIHFAGLKAVGQSVEQPLRYYDNNVTGSLALFEVMAEVQVKTLVFSSSATVYGDPHTVPVVEHFPLAATNPYGRTKLIVEDILRDMIRADAGWRIAILRYFNPVGAHPSGMIGEDPGSTPNNLMPIVCQVAVGKREMLSIFGNDYPTPDGTGVRDYIHVCDLATGHVRALNVLQGREGLFCVNLGTGKGYSVLEVIRAFEKASDRKIKFEFAGRRPGDVATCYADPTLANEVFGWYASKSLEQMCADAWQWQRQNPIGYVD